MTDAPQSPLGTASDFAGEDFDPATGARDMIDLGAPKAPPRDIPHRPLSETELSDMTAKIVGALKTVYDPEIPVDVYELGLIYKVDYDPATDEAPAKVAIEMTLTAPGCPVAGEMPGWVEQAVRRVDGIDEVTVEMTFDSPWTAERMSDEAKLELGWM